MANSPLCYHAMITPESRCLMAMRGLASGLEGAMETKYKLPQKYS